MATKTTIRDLLVKFGVDSDDALRDLDKLDGALNDIIGVAAGVVAGAVAVTAAIVGVGIAAASAGDQIDKGSIAAGISAEAYQELNFIAGQLGTSIEVVTKALGKQAIALGQLRDGAGVGGEVLGQLGLSYEELSKLSPDGQFLRTAEALSQVADDQERLELATKLYGEEMAQQMMPLLSAGSAGLEELAARAHELGIVMSEEDVAASVAFTDALDEVWQIVLGLRNAIGLQLIPILLDLMTRLREWWTANGQLIRQRLEAYMQILVRAIGLVADGLAAADAVVQRVLGGWEPILLAIAGAVAIVLAAFAAIAASTLWGAITAAVAALSGPVGALVAALAIMVAQLIAIGLILQDLIVYFRGGDSALGEFIARNQEAQGILGAVARYWERLATLAAHYGAVLYELGAVMVEVFQRIGMPILQLFGQAVMTWIAYTLNGVAIVIDNVVIPALDLWIAYMETLVGWIQTAAEWLGIVLDRAGEAGSALGLDIPTGGRGDSPFGGAGGFGGTDGGMSAGGRSGGNGAVYAGGSAGFVPSSGDVLPAAASAGGPRQTSVAVQGNSYTINGVGVSAEEVTQIIAENERERARATAQALAGAEV